MLYRPYRRGEIRVQQIMDVTPYTVRFNGAGVSLFSTAGSIGFAATLGSTTFAATQWRAAFSCPVRFNGDANENPITVDQGGYEWQPVLTRKFVQDEG